MDSNIILTLKHFEKPDKDFVKDKECLICLESVDTKLYDKESLNKIVKQLITIQHTIIDKS